MDDFFEKNGISREARIAIILNTFMYADKCVMSVRRMSLTSIVEQLLAEENSLEDSQKVALRMVKASLAVPDNAETGSLLLVNFSENMEGRYKGAYAATFINTEGTEAYVVFRGTGSGRWYDNGDALSAAASDYQKIALKYFEDTLNGLGLPASAKLVVTGHSKGGNLAQYVTLRSEKGSDVSLCISFDGQGFSPEFIDTIAFPNLRLKSRLERMYSICGDNDYVNVLGIKVIPEQNTVYIKTKPSSPDLYSAHSIIPQSLADYEKHWCDFLFDFEHNRFNEQTKVQRELARCSKAISLNTMELPKEKREDICRTLMTMLEPYMGGSGSNKGLNGETATTAESVGFLVNLYEIIIPLTAYAGKEAGNDIIFRIIVDQNDSTEDKSVLSRVKNIVCNPRILELYCLGAVIAIEDFADILYNEGYAVGRAAAPNLKRAILTVINSHSIAVNVVRSHIKEIKLLLGLPGIIGDLFSHYSTGLKSKAVLCSGQQADNAEEEWYDARAHKDNEGRRVLEGTDREDYIVGKDFDEVIRGYGGNDGLHGYGGDDEIYGGEGDDALYGENGGDYIYGEGGSDFISGGSGDDHLDGGDGDDNIRGNAGSDVLRGGVGDDTLNGGEGSDTLCGGLGNDRYVFDRGFGSDVISDSLSENVIEFRKITPDELKAELNEQGELIIEMIGTSDSIRVRNYSSERYGFVFGGESYKLADINRGLAFVKA